MLRLTGFVDARVGAVAVVSQMVFFTCSIQRRIMESSLALVFRARGWKWPHNALSTVLADLAAEGIKHPDTLFGVELGDVLGTEAGYAEVREFVRHSTQVRSAQVRCPLLMHLSTRSSRALQPPSALRQWSMP